MWDIVMYPFSPKKFGYLFVFTNILCKSLHKMYNLYAIANLRAKGTMLFAFISSSFIYKNDSILTCIIMSFSQKCRCHISPDFS
jgi:hypothetical protein